MSKTTMKAVVFKGALKIEIEDRPIPKIIHPTDILIKVRYSALCGSELHVFRGHQPSETGFIMGHETTGSVIEIGSSIKNHAVGDTVVMPFTVSCGACFYCQRGFSSRCSQSLLFGCPSLDGGQAEYMRVPLADATAVTAPPGIDEKKLVLMADIFPTGYFGAANAFKGMDESTIAQSVVVLIGCGPVGLCALINALEYKPRVIIAVDRVESRLKLARGLGAEAFNDVEDRAGLEARVKELTDGRGADTVIEGVGHADALKTAFDLLRPWGTISSFGVHNAEIPWNGNQAYGKNLRIQMGRCPVRSIFPEALEMLKKNQHKLDFMTDKFMPLSQAVEGYDIFNKMQVQKVVFVPEHQ
ncbi:related to formaldehyde dehydrogenase [Rhynchosporium secalis]|uniref:Related to formaldehyde dehydrogenase n=1 Tax=Rhynchosporium secalis TaxID=38038 RepID=A0A1E1MSS2_RHYSE|nr:related to formaldehyde dehydrogenase [Rhynchosporium secalis]